MPQHFGKQTYRHKVAAADSSEDLINGGVGRQRAVVDGELSLEALGDVVAAAARVDHGAHHLDVDDAGELTGLLQVVEALLLDHLTRDLIGHLVSEEQITK